MLVAAIVVLLVGVGGAGLVLYALKHGLSAGMAAQPPAQRRRGRLAGAAVAVGIVLTAAAAIAWGPVALLVVGGVLLVCFLGALPLVARADRQSHR